MNRKERRKLEKQIGIFKNKQKLSREKRLKMMSDNILKAKQKSEQMVEERRVEEQRKIDEVSQNSITSRALSLSVKEGITMREATQRIRDAEETK